MLNQNKYEGPLKKTLDRFYKEYNFKERIKHDPIEIPHRYSNSEDIEIAGFIASCFAYGKVGLFKPVIEEILKPAGKHPSRMLKNFNMKNDAEYFKGINYRFNKEKDILCFIYLLSETVKKWGSLKKLFYHHYESGHEDIRIALKDFVEYLLGINTSPVYGRNIKPSGLKQLFPNPVNGSACKRMNLFLRWMVRRNDIDFGIWDKVPASRLIIPLDTHIARISRCLGFTERKSSDWKTAKEITEALKRFDENDPLKYDFALCHHGISGVCRGEESPSSCSACAFSI